MDPETKSRFVLVRAELFQEMQAILADEERSLRDLDAWAKLARKARDQWAKENAY